MRSKGQYYINSTRLQRRVYQRKTPHCKSYAGLNNLETGSASMITVYYHCVDVLPLCRCITIVSMYYHCVDDTDTLITLRMSKILRFVRYFLYVLSGLKFSFSAFSDIENPLDTNANTPKLTRSLRNKYN